MLISLDEQNAARAAWTRLSAEDRAEFGDEVEAFVAHVDSVLAASFKQRNRDDALRSLLLAEWATTPQLQRAYNTVDQYIAAKR